MLKMPSGSKKDITNLKNWVEGNGCISRAETQYLEHASDLFSTARDEDDALARLEPRVEDILIFLHRLFRKVSLIMLPNMAF